MQCEATITSEDATEVIRLIEEYLCQGGTGFDDNKLTRVLDALSWADRIVITGYDGE